MIDKEFCNSSFLALRYIERSDMHFTDRFPYRHPNMPSDEGRILVDSENEIDINLRKQIEEKCTRYKKIGILLSGGMDSGILASYLKGIDAYTFRFCNGNYQQKELYRAIEIAKKNSMRIHYVDIEWNNVTANLKEIMIHKGGPVHSIETQIYQAAKQALDDGVDLMIIGDASDYIFGGMDQLLSKDWTFNEFINRYIYINPFEVLENPQSVQYLFEQYRNGEMINFVDMIEKRAAQESYGSYENAFSAAGLEYFDPYEKLKMASPLNLNRVRSGESKYFIRQLYRIKYPDISVPEKLAMPRPVDKFFATWEGPVRPEFKKDINIHRFNGNQRWLMWCLEQFLNLI